MSETNKPYPEVTAQGKFPEIERRVLAFWAREKTFAKSVDGRAKGENEYVFYDGPPFANGLPHYGHLLTGYVKDLIPRYQTMRGRRVDRVFGWDCHGLPAELEAEQQLGISGKLAISELGILKFNKTCAESVLRYTEQWERFVTRQARWVDFERNYKTMDLSYMESVIWAFKELHNKGLLYEDYRVMPYSWAAETPLSNFETRLDNAYRERTDPAITVRFELVPVDGEELATDVLAWTTTPWTLPSNLALAVGPQIDYAVLRLRGRAVILGEATLAMYQKELEGHERIGSIKGEELIGRSYKPLFPFFAELKGCFRILGADFIDTQEGSGAVHLAPGFGEDDMRVCKENGIAVVCPVDATGCFTSEVKDWEGVQVFDANKGIIRDLKERGHLFKREDYVHNYPHCWRTDTPLIYKAMSSWYVRVSEFRERMVELNQEICWIPSHVKDGLFGKWLEGARDWSITRNRFWGTPIPVWKSDDPAYPRIDVYGSLDELERDFGVRPDNLHRPYIDELTRPNPDDPSGKSTMRRVPDVLDCWFESGSMPYAQVHYPFENRDWFETHFPADFIVEYTAQTRGWFYTMVVLATALFDRPPFKNCICHGVILDESGKKLSKRLRNYPDPGEIFEKHGADAVRWYLMASPLLKGNELRIDKKAKGIAEVVRLVLNPIWNAYYFFTLYANSDGVSASFRTDADGVIDRYILAKTRDLIGNVSAHLDAYDIASSCSDVSTFIDALNNWYIRRSRERFWKSEQDSDKKDAYDTLYTVLTTLCRVTAPLLPLLTEEIYKNLTGEESVHLSDWPDLDAFPQDTELVRTMDRVREVCSTGLGLRRQHDLRVRQPLAALTIAGHELEALEPFHKLVREEVNVKEILVSDDIFAYAKLKLKINAPVLGPRLGSEAKKVFAGARSGDWKELEDHRVEVAGMVLEATEFELGLEAKEGVTCQALAGSDAIVVLDIELTEELENEGKARDLVRMIQQARKEAGLHVSDRIRLEVEVPADWRLAIEGFKSYVAEQTLAAELLIVEGLTVTKGSIHEAAQGTAKFKIGIQKL